MFSVESRNHAGFANVIFCRLDYIMRCCYKKNPNKMDKYETRTIPRNEHYCHLHVVGMTCSVRTLVVKGSDQIYPARVTNETNICLLSTYYGH